MFLAVLDLIMEPTIIKETYLTTFAWLDSKAQIHQDCIPVTISYDDAMKYNDRYIRNLLEETLEREFNYLEPRCFKYNKIS